MISKAPISPEEYLATHFEYEPEYVQGELLERPMPSRTHGEMVAWLLLTFSLKLRSLGYSAAPKVRCLLPNGNWLPHVAVFAPDAPREEVPTHPPAVLVEVLSDEDKHNQLLEKLHDYELWRVPHIWVVNPRFRTLETFQ